MIDDPRAYPDPSAATPEARELFALAEASLGAPTGEIAQAIDADIEARLAAWFDAADGQSLARSLASSPGAAVYRHLWRACAALAGRPAPGGLPVWLFALPIVIVAAADDGGERTLDAVLDDPSAAAKLLRDHDALGGCRQFGLGDALVATEAIDLARLPALLHEAAAFAERGAVRPIDLPPAPITTAKGHETAHLRFLVGSAIGGAAPASASPGAGWGAPLSRALSRAIARPGATVTALPRSPASLPVAIAAGRSARREVAAMLFASQAIRKLRSAVGEPVAIVSAHRCDSAPMGGELRLSLSSALAPKEAEGFRCPLDPLDRVADVATMLVDLLRDCRIGDVRTLAGIHPDRDTRTGLPLLFKPETLPPDAEARPH
ncbi:MAG: hypothetical protein U1F51_21055 [Burkholderiales bacterium]